MLLQCQKLEFVITFSYFNSNIHNHNFEFVPKPISDGGGPQDEALQALWNELQFKM